MPAVPAMLELSPDQCVWSALAALSLQFVAIGAGMREDKTFRFIGACLLVLVLMVGADIWVVLPAVQDGWGSKPYVDAAQLAYQALACGFLVLLMRFIRHLTGAPGKKAVRAQTAFFAFWILLASADALHPRDLFVGLRGGEWRLSPVYLYLFAPHGVITMCWLIVLAFARRTPPGSDESRVLMRLRIGMVLVFAFGMADLLVLMFPPQHALPSFSTWGVMGFCIGGTFVLADRMAASYRRRRDSLLEIARVHGELGAGEPLREIGRSAARVSDSIREGAAALRGRLETLSRAPAGGGAELARIERARGRLERLATAVLEYSRCGMLGPLSQVHPAELVEACVRERLPAAASRIRIRAAGPVHPVAMDGPRVAAAIFELLKNALEAGAGTVEVRVRQGLGKTVVAIEDDGEGLPEPAVSDIAKPFFTTRKGEGAAGLGASIAAGVLRAHGGSLRYYRGRDRGLTANLVLPQRPPPPGEAGSSAAASAASSAVCALVSDDPGKIEGFLAACENLGVRPYLVAGADGPASVPKGAVRADAGAGTISEEALLLQLA